MSLIIYSPFATIDVASKVAFENETVPTDIKVGLPDLVGV